MRAQKDGARVAHALEALVGHGEHADFVDRAKAVLESPDQPEAAVRIALEIQHGIHDVFQHARTGQLAIFGHVPHQHYGRPAGLGQAREMRRTLAHLRHAARGAAQGVAVHRLDRVDYCDLGTFGLQNGQNFFELNFGQHTHL